MTKNYLQILEDSYAEVCKNLGGCPPDSRLDYVGEYIFNFTTYDQDMSALFAKKAIEVCRAITEGDTFAFIDDKDRYMWYLLMCNMPFFEPKLSWGGSIRGAWWEGKIQLDTCGIWIDGEQETELEFTKEEWEHFMRALFEFVKEEL